MSQILLCQACSLLVLTYQNIVTLPWPARSPDLALIEHVLDILGRNVSCRHDVRTCPQMIAALLQMIAALRREFAAIPQNNIRTFIGLMRPWCTACILAEECHTSY